MRLEKRKLNKTQLAFQDTTQKKAGSMLDRKMTTLTDLTKMATLTDLTEAGNTHRLEEAVHTPDRKMV